MTFQKYQKQICIDGFILVTVLLPPIILYMIRPKVTRGFWCNDQSLSYPYKPDTVTTSVLLLVSFGTPLIVMSLTEGIRSVTNSKPRIFRRDMYSVVKGYLVFLFGIAATVLLTDTLKWSVARLRPHFFDVCKPDFSKLNCTSNGIDRPRMSMQRNLVFFGRFFAYLVLFSFLNLLLIVVNDVLQSRAIWDIFMARRLEERHKRISEDWITVNLGVRCGNISRYDALVLVHTAHTHFVRRDEIRQTFANFRLTKPYRLKVVFLVGIAPPWELGHLQDRLVKENLLYRDTLQGNFVDTYYNLTYKAMTGFRWASTYCTGVKLVIKMDDDVLFHVHKFFQEFWPQASYVNDMIHCHGWKHPFVERHGKWSITKDEYGEPNFPPYCSGFFVVIPARLIHDLYRVGRAMPFLWIDDVFIYGIVRKETKAQFVFMDQVNPSPTALTLCHKEYGSRCKYVATVLDRSRPFVKTVLRMVGESFRYDYNHNDDDSHKDDGNDDNNIYNKNDDILNRTRYHKRTLN